MLKIGIISDIHADLEGLEKALAIFESAKVDKILCAGDLVERGNEGDAVVQRIRDAEIPCVLGNHDMLARSNQVYCLKYPERFPNYPALSQDSLSFVESLPPVLHFELEGKRICMAHGAPWHVDTYVYLRQPPSQFYRVLEEADAEIVILGHTHQPMLVEVEETGWILNAGSTNSNNLPASIMLEKPVRQRSCGILSLPHFRFQVYDLDTGKPLNLAHRVLPAETDS